MKVNYVYKTASEFEALVETGRLYEGFVIGVGYAYLYSDVSPAGNLNGFGNYTNDPPEHNRHSIAYYQVIDTSPKMIELSLRKDMKGEIFVVKIKRGDTLAGISQTLGVSVEQLAKWNGLNNLNAICEGDVLFYEGESAKISPAPTPTASTSGYEPVSKKQNYEPLVNTTVVSLLKFLLENPNFTSGFSTTKSTFGLARAGKHLFFIGFKGGGANVGFRALSLIKDVSNAAKIVGLAGVTVAVGIDFHRWYNGEISGEEFVVNTVINAVSYHNPAIGIFYALTEAFYPGGSEQAIKDRGELEAERRKVMGDCYLPLSAKSYW